MQPIRYDPDNVPVFSSDQIDDYGFPEYWGFEVYRIVENRDTMNLTTDYKMESSYYRRPIHRYCQKSRFLNVLYQLLGDRGKVPEHIVTVIKSYIKPGELWNQVRKILKHYKFSLYYNRIPYIIQQITQQNSVPKIHVDQYRSLIEDFDRFQYWFQHHKQFLNRTYFPNMRFIALKLIEKHGIHLNYTIPLARTQRKLKQLEHLWSLFIQ
jgi:hypothetical protein